MTLPCVKKKIDSNVVGLAFAEEDCLGTLPDLSVVGDELGGVWHPLDPNEFSDFGAEIKTVVRRPLNASRQRRKGVVTDIDSKGGFSQDLTQINLQRIMQGFFFANYREKTTTHPLTGLTTHRVTLGNFTAAALINVTAGHQTKFIVGNLLKTQSNAQSTNNKDNVIVSSVASGVVNTTGFTFAAETVTAANKVDVVGHQFATGDATLDVNGATIRLLTTVQNLTLLNLNVGEWIFIGGEAVDDVYSFDASTNVPGFARISAIAANAITLEQCTWVAVDDTAAAKTIRIYFGKYLRNEKDPQLIIHRTYQLERSLGSDADGPQYEYLVGATPNEFKMALKSADKIMADLSFVGTNADLRTFTEGRRGGDHTATITSEDAFNTSSDVYQMRLFIHDPLLNEPPSLFAYVEDMSIDINNNAEGLKAIGTIGSFAVNIGDFEVGGTINAYFATVAAVQAIKDNADVSFNIIAARENAGFVYDLPLLSLGNGNITVVKDKPIMLPISSAGAENDNGYTLSATYFTYLPDSAMPTT